MTASLIAVTFLDCGSNNLGRKQAVVRRWRRPTPYPEHKGLPVEKPRISRARRLLFNDPSTACVHVSDGYDRVTIKTYCNIPELQYQQEEDSSALCPSGFVTWVDIVRPEPSALVERLIYAAINADVVLVEQDARDA